VTAFANPAAADIVIGQSGFASTNCNRNGLPNAATLCNTVGIALDGSENLYVADEYNHQVLVYRTPQVITTTPGSGDTAADQVLGQAGSFLTNSANILGVDEIGPNLLTDVALDTAGSRLFIADTGNNRVLIHTNPSTDVKAYQVIGKSSSFTTAECSKSGKINANTLCNPYFLAVNDLGDLYVSDSSNNRVLKFNTPLATGGNTTADKVFGQGNLFNQSSVKGLSPNSLYAPVGVSIDEAGSLYIADQSNHRVLQFLAP
jgi:hypothetical protein